MPDRGASISRPVVKTHTRPRGYLKRYRPQARTVALLNDVHRVLDEYVDHWPLTVRQIFYRLVGAYHYPKKEEFYARLCDHLANARRARFIPFEAIRDDGVPVIQPEHFEDVDHFLGTVQDLRERYRRDKLARQRYYVEVWCEAAGMVPQLAAVADRYSVAVYSSSGFDSLTAKHDLACRIVGTVKPAVILHLGDYDPSGEAIFTAAAEDVRAFVRADRFDARVDVEFRRVALTQELVEAYSLPTAPAKVSDGRSRRWMLEGRGGTVQLEALAPNALAELLEHAIASLFDPVVLAEDRLREEEERRRLAYAIPPPGAQA